jgi:glycine cleavage system H protein
MLEEINGFKFDPQLYYWEHVWAKIEADGNIRVGFDDVIAKGSVKIFSIKLLPTGTAVVQKKKIGIMESTKYTGPIVCPISGTIVAVNDDVKKRGANAFKNDPYGSGWLCVIKPTNLEAELKNIMSDEIAEKWFTEEADKNKENIAAGEQGTL